MYDKDNLTDARYSLVIAGELSELQAIIDRLSVALDSDCIDGDFCIWQAELAELGLPDWPLTIDSQSGNWYKLVDDDDDDDDDDHEQLLLAGTNAIPHQLATALSREYPEMLIELEVTATYCHIWQYQNGNEWDA